MYAKGMTTHDMEAHIQDMYGLKVSDTSINRITDKYYTLPKNGNNGHWKICMLSYF